MKIIRIIIVGLLSFFFCIELNAQTSISCPFISPVANPATICTGQCTNLTATALTTKATTTYTVQSIPHSPPLPYTTTVNGTPVSVGDDDVWSDVITLPFKFCFYGASYDKVLIGSNGNLTFKLTEAQLYCPWMFGSTVQVPSTNLKPAGNIFGPYHDIDPRVSGGTINWFITGSAPCRKFVVIYNNLAHYSSSCNSLKSTFMIVLNEITNYIDVYVNSKPTCAGWNEGNAIIGIQNTAGNAGIAAPGRNNTTPDWSVTTPEAWRFLPNGADNYTISWTGPSGAISSANPLGPINVCPTTNTTYTATLSITNCDSPTPVTFTNTVNVSVNSSTEPIFNTVNPICQGENLSSLPLTSNNGISGTWAPALNNNATTTYTFTPNPGLVCVDSSTLGITVNPKITPLFNQVPGICIGSPIANLPTNSNNNITGTWAPPIDNSVTTTYVFTPDNGQCANQANMTIAVNNDTPPIFSQIPPVCEGSIINLPNTSTNGIVGSWTPPINNTTTTTYTFLSDPNQCASPDTIMTIVIEPKIIPDFNSIAPICQGAILNLPTLSNNSISGTWLPAINNLATTTYTFTPSAGQCADTISKQVIVSNGLPATFNQLNPICSGDTLVLPATSVEGFTGTWSPAISNTNSGTYTFTPDAGQCAIAASITTTVNPIPDLTTVLPQTVCAGVSTTAINFAPANLDSVSWTNSQTGIGLAAGGLNAISPFIGTNTSTSSLIGTIVATPYLNGCEGASKTFSITVKPVPVLSPITDTAVCAGQSVNAINFSSSINTATVNWTNTTAGIGLSTSGINSISSFTSTNSGNTPLTATITAIPTANACAGLPKTFSITVNPNPSDITTNNPIENCGNADAELVILGATGGATPYEYSFNNGTLSSTTTYSNLTAGNYTLTVKDNNGCLFNKVVIIGSRPGIHGIVATPVNANCGGADGLLSVSPIAGTNPFQYSFNGQAPSGNPTLSNIPAGNYTVSVTDANNCRFDTVIIIGSTPPLNANFSAGLQLLGNDTMDLGPTTPGFDLTYFWNYNSLNDTLNAVFINSSSAASGVIYTWLIDNGTVIDTIVTNNLNNLSQNIPVQYLGSKSITITLIASNGNQLCNDTAKINIEIKPFIYVPNVFSPNGDGVNDNFFVNYRGYKELNLIIFNRWGNKLYETTDPLKGWDGSGASEGTYFYVVLGTTNDGNTFEAKGYLTLVR